MDKKIEPVTVKAHLGRMLRNPKLRKSLLTAESPEKVIALVKEAEAQM